MKSLNLGESRAVPVWRSRLTPCPSKRTENLLSICSKGSRVSNPPARPAGSLRPPGFLLQSSISHSISSALSSAGACVSLSLPSRAAAPGAGSTQPLPEQHLGNRPSGHAFYCCCDYYCLLVDLLCALKECNHPQEQISKEKLHLCRSNHCFPFLFIFLSRPARGSEQKSESVPAPCPHPEPEHCFALLGHPYNHHMLPLYFLLTCGASKS